MIAVGFEQESCSRGIEDGMRRRGQLVNLKVVAHDQEDVEVSGRLLCGDKLPQTKTRRITTRRGRRESETRFELQQHRKVYPAGSSPSAGRPGSTTKRHQGIRQRGFLLGL